MCKYTLQRRLGSNGWEDITASMPKKAAEEHLKTIRATRIHRFWIEYQIWPALPKKDKAVNCGGRSRMLERLPETSRALSSE